MNEKIKEVNREKENEVQEARRSEEENKEKQNVIDKLNTRLQEEESDKNQQLYKLREEMNEKIREVNREKEKEVKEARDKSAEFEKMMEEATEVYIDKWSKEWMGEIKEWKEYGDKKDDENKKLQRELGLFYKKGIYDRRENNWK